MSTLPATAGRIPTRVIEMQGQKKFVNLRQRSYKPSDELNRSIDIRDNMSRIVRDLLSFLLGPTLQASSESKLLERKVPSFPPAGQVPP